MFSSSSRLVFALLFVVTSAASGSAQDALRRFQRAILRGDAVAAESSLRDVQGLDTPTRATLQAAAMDVAPRAMAMRQIARIFPDHGIADTAIVAGCAALLSSQGHGDMVPGLDRPAPDRKLPEGFALTDLIRDYRAMIAFRRKAPGADLESLHEAEWMLRTLSVNEIVGTTRRVLAGTRLPVPSPLREDMHVRFYPWDLDRPLPLVFRDPDNRSIDGGPLKKDTYGQTVMAPPPGVYVVEMSATATGWSRLERVIVSDLNLVSQSWPGTLAVMASTEQRDGASTAAAGIEITLQVSLGAGRAETLVAKSDASGLARFDLPSAAKTLVLTARSGRHIARIRPTVQSSSRQRKGQWKSHLMVDRPIYRPGDKVQGRLLLRREEPRPTKTPDGEESRAFRTEVVRDRNVEVRFWPKTKQEIVLRGRTDEHGVFPFAMRLARSAPLQSAPVDVLLKNADGKDARLRPPSPFRVEEYRRPVILATASGPTSAGRNEPFQIELASHYASGPPASGIRADITAHCGGLSHKTTIALDAKGKARVPIQIHELPLPSTATTVRVTAQFQSPDGQRITETHYTKIAAVRVPERPRASRASGIAFARVGAGPRAGEPLRISVSGKPSERVLLTVLRDVPREVRVVALDATGRAELVIETTPDDFPGLQLVASLESGRPAAPVLTRHFPGWEIEEVSDSWRWSDNVHRKQFSLHAPFADLVAEIETADVHRPGATAELGVRVTRDGKPARCTVAVTIVDETIYSLQADLNRDPTSVLKPSYSAVMSTAAAGTPHRGSAWHILGRLLRLGRMDEPEIEEEMEAEEMWNEAIGLGGGAGGKFGGRSGGRSALRTRREFRSTAHFVGNLRTDAEGRARFTYQFPDDVTRWRITAIAVSDGFDGVKAVSATETRLPVTVTPVLPRIARVGDELSVQIAASCDSSSRESSSRETDAAGSVELTSASDSLIVKGAANRTIRVVGDKATRETFEVRGAQKGIAKLTATAMVGETGDRAELPLPILDDLVVRPVAASKLITHKGEITLPRERGLATGQTLRLLGNREALLREASTYLSGYPYGCVEQVLSRLTPIFVAARATRMKGGDGPSLSEEQGLRLEAGMVALRGHLVSSGRGFRWWHGGEVDRRMTALALNSLMLAREAGIDPERYGVKLRCGASEFTRIAKALTKQEGILETGAAKSAGIRDAELVAALLRYDPKVTAHRQAVTAVLAADQALPAGLLARLGLAMKQCGDDATAARARDRILTGDRILQETTPRGMRFPMDRVAARKAHLLELVLRIDPKHEARARTVGTLLALQRDGKFGSTYSTAAALSSLALDAQLSGHKPSEDPIRVAVSHNGREREFTLSKDNGFEALCHIDTPSKVRLEVGDRREVFALLRGGVESPGSTHAGWSEPIRVRRSLFAVTIDEAGKTHRTEIRGDAVPRGTVVELAIDLACREAVSYLVVDCPLPAGFEVLGRPRGVEVRDDRVVKLVRSLRSTRDVRIRVPMIAAHDGSVAWPPAVAQAMYSPEMSGACAGARLTVVEPKASAAAAAEAKPLLTRTFLDAQLAAPLAQLKTTRSGETARSLLRQLESKFFVEGRKVVLPLAAGLMHRFPNSIQVLSRLHQVVSTLPEARAARAASLRGDSSELGFLLLAFGGPKAGDGEAWRKTLRAMLEDDFFGGLSQAERRPLLLSRFSQLVGQPWRRSLTGSTTKATLLHSDSEAIADDLVAWQPVLRAAISMLHSQPDFGAPRSVVQTSWLGDLDFEFGAAPSASLEFAREKMNELSWRLAEPLLPAEDRVSAAVRSHRFDWLPLLDRTTDRDRLVEIYDAMLDDARAAQSSKENARVLRRLLQGLPTAERPRLAHHYLACLAHARVDVRWTALTAMPVEMRRQLPETVLSSAFAGSKGRLSTLRPLGTRGVRIVRQWLVEGRTFLEPSPTTSFLGPRNIRGLPLKVLARLADVGTVDTLRKALAEADFPLAELQMEFHDNAYGPWRVSLVQELARRGARKVLVEKDDPLGTTYNRLLGALQGGVAETLEVARRLREDDAKRRGSWQQRRRAMPRYLHRALVASIAGRMQPQEYLAWSGSLSSRDRKRVLESFGMQEWRYLLAKVKGDPRTLLRHLPKQIERALLPDLLSLVDRTVRHRPATTTRILGVEGGERFLREALQTGELSVQSRKSIAKTVFRFSGVRVEFLSETGSLTRFHPTDTSSVAARIRRHGFGPVETGGGVKAEWTTKERGEMRTLLRRRGILPATR